MGNDKKENQGPVLPNQTMMFLRGFIGLYLVYLGFTLFRDESYVAPRMIVYVFSVLFIVVGAIIAIWVVKIAIKGEYQGGKADPSIYEDDDEEIEVIDAEKVAEEEKKTEIDTVE